MASPLSSAIVSNCWNALTKATTRESVGASGIVEIVAEIAASAPPDEALLFQAARVAGNLAADCGRSFSL
jgi:hypothetical protein